MEKDKYLAAFLASTSRMFFYLLSEDWIIASVGTTEKPAQPNIVTPDAQEATSEIFGHSPYRNLASNLSAESLTWFIYAHIRHRQQQKWRGKNAHQQPNARWDTNKHLEGGIHAVISTWSTSCSRKCAYESLNDDNILSCVGE